MEPVRLLLVGCGMMGARHVRGLAELEKTTPGKVKLLAVCDMRQELAEKVATEAEQLFSSRPKVFTSLEKALKAEPSLEAADVVTDPRSHDKVVAELFNSAIHVICEKPLALTVARGQRMLDAAKRARRTFAVAENNRRDPMNRLARACLDAGLIGRPNFALQLAMHGGTIVGTAWRHRLAMGGVIFDVALHLGYILEYLMGPIDTVCAKAQLVQPKREGKEYDGKPVAVDVDAEDAVTALLTFKSGAQGHWTSHFSDPGEAMFKRLILGSAGTLDSPGDRSGRPVVIQRGKDKISGDALLRELPSYRLNDIETRLFGDRPAQYTLQGPETDRKLIASEMDDFFTALRTGQSPEADGAAGLRSVAIIYAMLESALAGAAVKLDDVLSGKVHAYQDKVEAAQMSST
ncbi:MAG: Gfo/Idh/MocA family oxidoreductase [Planctomycetes bacterium]|nr:Gfo/Idh/MocA family oxidoreductase [Planctomycetota bacterium]